MQDEVKKRKEEELKRKEEERRRKEEERRRKEEEAKVVQMKEELKRLDQLLQKEKANLVKVETAFSQKLHAQSFHMKKAQANEESYKHR